MPRNLERVKANRKKRKPTATALSHMKQAADDPEENNDKEVNSDDTPKHKNSAGDEFGCHAHFNTNWGDDD